MVVSSAWTVVAMARPTRPDRRSFFMTVSFVSVGHLPSELTFSQAMRQRPCASDREQLRSSLQAADGQALDEAALSKKKTGDHRRHDHHGRSHQGTHVGAGFLITEIENAARSEERRVGKGGE